MPADAQTTRDFKEVPAEVLQMSIGHFEVGDNGENSKTAPITMLARSGKPVEHWYWGRVVHDLSGMTLNRQRLPIDYIHRQEQPIGYLNKFNTDSGDLVCSGALTPYGENDIASEVIYKAHQGVPFEASINFAGDDVQIEEIGENQVAQVNGYEFTGPGIIIRKWPLRGVALCLYGQDSNTKSEFTSQRKVSVGVFNNSKHEEKIMSEKDEKTKVSDQVEAKVDDQIQTETAEAETGELAQASEAVEAKTESEVVDDSSKQLSETDDSKDQTAKAPGQEFMEQFGEQAGAVYFAKGLSMEEAMKQHFAKQNEKIADLEARLKAADRGADEAVEFSDQGEEAEPTPEQKRLEKLTKAFDGDEERAKRALDMQQKQNTAA